MWKKKDKNMENKRYIFRIYDYRIFSNVFNKKAPLSNTIFRGHQAAVALVVFSDQYPFSASSKMKLFILKIQSRRIVKTLKKFKEGDDRFLRACTYNSKILCNSRLGFLFEFEIEGNDLVEIEIRISGGFVGCRLHENGLYFADAFERKVMILKQDSHQYFHNHYVTTWDDNVYFFGT
jgi:hypothetical protein